MISEGALAGFATLACSGRAKEQKCLHSHAVLVRYSSQPDTGFQPIGRGFPGTGGIAGMRSIDRLWRARIPNPWTAGPVEVDAGGGGNIAFRACVRARTERRCGPNTAKPPGEKGKNGAGGPRPSPSRARLPGTVRS